MSQICRACLEPSKKMYPLVGRIANVDVNIASMISYCTSSELLLDKSLPNNVCVSCFKIIRIAYNFLRQFKESQEKLLAKNLEEVIEEDKNNEDANEIDFIVYNFETIHNYAQKKVETKEKFVGNENIKLLIVKDEPDSDVDISDSIRESVQHSDESNDSFNDNVGYISPDSSCDHINITTAVTKTAKPKSESDTCANIFSCPVCKLEFLQIQKFNDHVRLHNINSIICTKCPVSVSLNMSQYIQHFKELHRYQCNLCGKRLTSSYGFRYHMKQHENIRKYVCRVKGCNRTYFLKHLLKKHMETHSNTIKYWCNLCNAKFKNYDTLRYHKKTHDGKRNHLCTLCGKAFFQAVHLRDHIFRHTGYKQFTCDGCGRSFTTNSQLKKHLRHCHP